ncbi:hypothetical protein [Leptolyngbya sp. NIES-2104]|nr:hypothetical protein [Leptolyngbya sp. NIES-2104]GAP96811.1 hypothetical protein NIES2104_33580 [Leptolyngbya sp. NIES-2104]
MLTFDQWLAAGHAEAIAKLLPPLHEILVQTINTQDSSIVVSL